MWPPDCLTKTVDHAEAETASLVGRLGREERFESPLKHFRRHTHSTVAHRQQDVVTGYDLRMARCILLIEADVFRLDDEAAAAEHGVARIDRQVENSLIDL